MNPEPSRWLLALFGFYAERHLRRHFHAIRLAFGVPLQVPDGVPCVVYMNHASWWDPMVGLFLQRRFFRGRMAAAPMDAESLQRYRFFRKLGFFGVERHSRRGASAFMKSCQSVLRHPGAMIWLTPQGRFADVRERPVRFEAGLGHLPFLAERTAFLPLAVEYVFWEERLPEILVCAGTPEIITHKEAAECRAAAWTAHFESQLTNCMERLARASLERRATDFEMILAGGSGVGAVYDRWCAWRARWLGRPYRASHGRM